MHDELTANDIKKMEDEIEYRKLVVRKKALDDVKVARAQGDLSENFEYKAAKQFKNQNESRIRYLEKMISKESPLGAAIFGHKVGDRCEVKVNDDYSYFVKIMKIQNTVDDGSDDLRKF